MRAGKILARFHSLGADLDVAQLAEPLPGFHNLPGYMQEFDHVLAANPRELVEAGRSCLETIDRVRPRTTFLEDARQAGILTVQPIHGDPKIDNFIFSESGAPDGMLDFDTVGGGLIHYDLGDCLRSCCNRAGEKGKEPSSVSFDLRYCRSFLEGYLSGGSLLGRGPTELDLRGGASHRLRAGSPFFHRSPARQHLFPGGERRRESHAGDPPIPAGRGHCGQGAEDPAAYLCRRPSAAGLTPQRISTSTK